MKTLRILCCIAAMAMLLPAQSRTLDIYWIDVEGGASTLIVAPSGETVPKRTSWSRVSLSFLNLRMVSAGPSIATIL